ncbi:MAG: 50S ribosomal protein L25 [Flavobacteriales bacterium]|nr:50S ribosomal protein L25 [Flavobacteriales bacterium]
MKTASLSGSLRENVGKKGASAIRKSGSIPGVLYGGQDQTHFTVEENSINKLVFNPDVFYIELDIDGKKVHCILQDIQFHPVTDRIVHIDLLEVVPGKEVRVNLPLRSEGTAEGVMNGGRIATLFRRVPVKGMIEKIPEAITVDITPLVIGSTVRVRDLNIEGCTILLNESVLLFACKRTRLAVADEDLESGEAEGAAEGAEGESEEGSEGGDA